MSRILAIDLGKFKSVTCLLDSDTNQTEFWTMSTDRQYLLAVLPGIEQLMLVERAFETHLLHSDTIQTEFWSMSTDHQYLLAVLKNYHPDLVVIESCGLAGWVHDICTEEGYEVLVCNPNQEAWKWKHIKRKICQASAPSMRYGKHLSWI